MKPRWPSGPLGSMHALDPWEVTLCSSIELLAAAKKRRFKNCMPNTSAFREGSNDVHFLRKDEPVLIISVGCRITRPYILLQHYFVDRCRTSMQGARGREPEIITLQRVRCSMLPTSSRCRWYLAYKSPTHRSVWSEQEESEGGILVYFVSICCSRCANHSHGKRLGTCC